MARNLASEYIPYTLTYQVWYDLDDAGTYVAPSQIIEMRCDGVVEYIYEWYGFRVYGNDNYWDVTKNSFWAREEHSAAWIYPKTQRNYLTWVTNDASK